MFKSNAIIFLSIVLGACAITASSQSSTLPYGEWRLTQINGRAVRDSKAFIRLDGGRLSGIAGCNRMFGTVTGGRGIIRFSRIGTTKMFCSDANANRAENEFLRAIESVTRYGVSRGGLTLYAGRSVVLRFSQQPAAQPPSAGDSLEGRKWMLESIGGTPVSGKGKSAFINFDAAKQTAGGDTGCNLFGGSYTASGGKISITDVISTMRACIEDDRMTIERKFLDGLGDADRYEITGEKLQLFAGKKLLLAFRGAAKQP